MDLSRLGRNLLFAVIILVIVGSIDEADLPITQRVEEYIAFVLTTDFDYGRWIDRAGVREWLPSDLDWSRWVPWMSGGGLSVQAPAEEPDRDDR